MAPQLEKVKPPDPLVLGVTVPVGVVGLTELSVTVTIQAVAAPTSTELGTQETVVEVVRTPTTMMTGVAVVELDALTLSTSFTFALIVWAPTLSSVRTKEEDVSPACSLPSTVQVKL